MTGWMKTAVAATAVAGVATLGSALTAQTVHFADDGVQVFKALFSGRLGVSVRDLDDEDLKKVKGATTGVIIEEVQNDTAAQKAGLKANDVIVEFDGERIRSTRQFTRLVQESPLGRSAPIVVVRDGQRVSLNVDRRDDSSGYFDFGKEVKSITRSYSLKPPPFPKKIDEVFAYRGRLGIGIQELSSQLAEYFGTKDGVLVTSVTDNSVASKTGLKAGDVITSFDGQAINSTAELTKRTQSLDPGADFTVGVVRDKKSIMLKGKLDPPQPRRGIGARAII